MSDAADRIWQAIRELAILRDLTPASWPRMVIDIVAFRLLRFMRLPREDAWRTVRMRDGVALTYRLNRGDIQGLREIWREHAYRPPADLVPLGNLLDLGANVGFSVVYFARRCGATRVLAVEPDPANIVLLRRNIEQNGIDAEIVQAAVADRDGRARFARSGSFNLGQLSDAGDLDVDVVSVPTVLQRLSGEVAVKFDIEGGENDLFAGDVGWLSRVRFLTGELHLEVADRARIEQVLAASGLRMRLGGTLPSDPKTCYAR